MEKKILLISLILIIIVSSILIFLQSDFFSYTLNKNKVKKYYKDFYKDITVVKNTNLDQDGFLVYDKMGVKIENLKINENIISYDVLVKLDESEFENTNITTENVRFTCGSVIHNGKELVGTSGQLFNKPPQIRYDVLAYYGISNGKLYRYDASVNSIHAKVGSTKVKDGLYKLSHEYEIEGVFKNENIQIKVVNIVPHVYDIEHFLEPRNNMQKYNNIEFIFDL